MDEHTDRTPLPEAEDVLTTLREKYLFAFRNAMLFGKCAGTVTELPLLHRATLTLELEKAAEDSSHIEQLRTQIEFTEGEIKNEFARMRHGQASKNFLVLNDKRIELEKDLKDAILDEAIVENASPEEPDTTDLAKIAYNGLLDELRKADDYVQSEYKKAKRTNRWDSIVTDQPGVRDKLIWYIKLLHGEVFRERSLEIISFEELLQSFKRQVSQVKEGSLLGRVEREDYFRKIETIGIIEQQMDELESLCHYRTIRDEFLSEIYPMIYGRAWKVQREPQSYEELMLEMETSTQYDPTRVLRIFGDPGQGKSTLLQQLAYDFATNQLVHQKDHMPFYFKAKHIARLGTTLLSQGASGTVERINNEPFLDDFETEEIVDALFESDADLKEYITREELIRLILLEGEDANAKPRCIFIDAFDECSTVADQEFVREFIKNEVEDLHSNIIVTCRTTHMDSLQIESNKAYTCLLRYTDQELRREMPKKLSDAWGINRDMLTIPTNLYFDKYQSVLTHPLYVGWFCFLLRNNKLKVAKQPDIEIMQGNSTLNELHIAFLKQVIEVGIEISIAEKYPTKIDAFNQKNIYDLFRLIAANYFTMNTQNLDVILTRIKRVHPTIQISELEDDFIRSNMGLLFVNDENTLEFTHETLPEVALGLIFEEERFADEYLPKSAEESGLMHRRDLINSSAWSQCIVLTRAVLRKNRGEGTLKSCIIDLLPSVPGPFIEQTIGMLTVNEGPIISIQNDGLYPYMNQEKNDPSQDEMILYEVGKKYIESIENSERFPLEFPARFRNQADSSHPVDVIYQHTTIFDCSDLLITTDLLALLQGASPASASRILDLWTDEGEVDNPILLQWYLGHVRHGSFSQDFESNFLNRLTWDGQRKIQSISLNNAASRLISGLEYSLSLSAGRTQRLLQSSTNRPFLNHILSPVQQNQDIDLVFLIERHGEKLRNSLMKSSELLSKTIREFMIRKPPVRQDKQMSNNSIQMHIARILEIPSVSNALLQYFAAALWFHCKHPEISLIQRGNLHRQDREELERFWHLFEQDMSRKKAQTMSHPINIIYSNSKKVPEVLLNLMDILLPYIGTDARSKVFEGQGDFNTLIDRLDVKKMDRKRMKKFHFKHTIEKMFEDNSTISGTYKREQND